MDSLRGTFLKLRSGLQPCTRLSPRRLIALATLIVGMAQISCSDNPLGPNDVASIELGRNTKITLALGDTIGFYALLKNESGVQLFDKIVTWASSNDKVASVSSYVCPSDPSHTPLCALGIVTGVGVSTITATSEGRSTSVTVVTFPYHAVVSETLPQNPIIAIGNKFAFRVKVLDTQGNVFPEKLVWTSDNPSVVTVDDNGRLTARSVGSAYIGVGLDDPPWPSMYVQVIQPAPIGTITSLTLNYRTACAVNNIGAAFCWGDGGEGQLANGDPGLNPPVGIGNSAMIPVQVPGAFLPSTVFPSVHHSCGLSTDRAAFCWGRDAGGALGDALSRPQQVRPVAVVGGHTFSTIGTGFRYTCALEIGGAAYCWGSNQYELVGTGFASSSVPVALTGGVVFANLSVGFRHACGIATDGVTYCWGPNSSGELGDGSTTDRATPVPVVGGASFVQVSAGERATCGLTPSGAAYCWGANSAGQLGDGTTNSHAIPAPVAGNLVFTSISLGNDHACGVQSSGAAYCWGDNSAGGLGDGSTVSSSVPVKVSGGLVFSSVQAGLGSSCGLTTSKIAYCWGNADYGQLGDGTGAPSTVPVKVAGQP
jgi:alpha-tubulin suppressor-like RCC1 family protein